MLCDMAQKTNQGSGGYNGGNVPDGKAKKNEELSINYFLQATHPRVTFLHSLHTVSKFGLLTSL